jgi:hypothetical protein
MVLSLMACALLSSGVARLLARPMYAELAAVTALGFAGGTKTTPDEPPR